MDEKTKQNIFSGSELDKLKDFCKDCAEEDKRIHEKRQNNNYSEEENNEPPKEEPSQQPPQPKPEQYNPPPSNNNYNQPSAGSSNNQDFKDHIRVKKLNENDPDPFNARIKFDTFDERVKQFGSSKK